MAWWVRAHAREHPGAKRDPQNKKMEVSRAQNLTGVPRAPRGVKIEEIRRPRAGDWLSGVPDVLGGW